MTNPMHMKKTRRQMRGKPLLPQCRRAKISHNELPGCDGCYGLCDYGPQIYNDACKDCPALVTNIEPNFYSPVAHFWRDPETGEMVNDVFPRG